MCITDLGYNQKAIITKVDASCPHVQRLMTMGFVEGATVEHLTSAGSAYEIEVMGTRIAFSAEQAQHFTVEPV